MHFVYIIAKFSQQYIDVEYPYFIAGKLTEKLNSLAKVKQVSTQQVKSNVKYFYIQYKSFAV